MLSQRHGDDGNCLAHTAAHESPMSFSMLGIRIQKLPQNVLFAPALFWHSRRMEDETNERSIVAIEHTDSGVFVSNARVPRIIEMAGARARLRFLEYFTADIRNKGTREAYARAIGRFLDWCDASGCRLEEIRPIVVSSYIELLTTRVQAPTTKMHLAAIRKMFDYLVIGQVIPMNPAASVRGPKHVVKKGKTPVLSSGEARQLLDAIDVASISGLRDRALIGVMVYSFARVSAVIGMNVEDYFAQRRRMWFRLREKGGKHHDVPAHHKAEEYVDAYVAAAEIRDQPLGPLFRTVDCRRQLTNRRMLRGDVLRMVKRRARGAGIQSRVCSHTMRATGITSYLENGGSVEHAKNIANHESIRTTKLYDRRSDEPTLEEIERIHI
ncbi:MAG: tyrosine-type recombinase/integrase [Planctomycetales bacterium]|nr:tyrosine-type recombinase/integrase [Planctomycetales bacterium]